MKKDINTISKKKRRRRKRKLQPYLPSLLTVTNTGSLCSHLASFTQWCPEEFVSLYLIPIRISKIQKVNIFQSCTLFQLRSWLSHDIHLVARQKVNQPIFPNDNSIVSIHFLLFKKKDECWLPCM
jgi:hypothetical protein